MSTLFVTTLVPPQLAHMQERLTYDNLTNGFKSLRYRAGSPGYKAVTNPVTPLDKAFQIYTLHLMDSNNYDTESSTHHIMWEKRDAAWSAAANWLMSTQDIYRKMDKTQTRALLKIMPEVIRCQCSLELPAGSWNDFPKDTTRKSKEIDEAMDILQNLGLNQKIWALAISEGDKPKKHWVPPKDHGTLENMLNSIEKSFNLAQSHEIRNGFDF